MLEQSLLLLLELKDSLLMGVHWSLLLFIILIVSPPTFASFDSLVGMRLLAACI